MAVFGCVQAMDEICKYFKTVQNFADSSTVTMQLG